MPEYSPSDPGPTPKSSKAPAAAPSAASRTQKPASWPGLAALLLAVIAVVLAVIGWFRPPTGPGSFSDEQKAEAKKNICTAANTVGNAVGINTNLTNPAGDNEVGGLAVAANARLALSGGGAFLHNRLETELATPADLHKAVADYANTLQELSVNYMAGAGPASSVQQPLRDNLKSQFGEIASLCQE